MTYAEFINKKSSQIPESGFVVGPTAINPMLFDFQRDIACWALRKGKAAIFADCGLGKTLMQLEWAHKIHAHTGMDMLIVAPLSVTNQTKGEGEKFNIPVTICRKQSDVKSGINITNYEMVHHFDINHFVGIVLDESSIIKSFSGATRNYLIGACVDIPYKLACTATPAPNDHMELGNHAEFLGIMSRTEMLSTFFVHDSGETQKWRLKGHAEDKFWEWVASWAVVVKNPNDMGYHQEGYDLPPLEIKEHIVRLENEHIEESGQISLLPVLAKTLNDRRAARRNSMQERVSLAAEIANGIDEQFIIWCDLNAEGEALSKAVMGAVEVAGRHTDEHKINAMNSFLNGNTRVIVSKPSIFGFGINMQNCHNMIYVGLSDSWEQFYQSLRRCYRFGQKNKVNVHVIISEQEGSVLENIKRKQSQADEMIKQMAQRTKNLFLDDIKQTQRISESYHAHDVIKLPSFLKGAVQ